MIAIATRRGAACQLYGYSGYFQVGQRHGAVVWSIACTIKKLYTAPQWHLRMHFRSVVAQTQCASKASVVPMIRAVASISVIGRHTPPHLHTK